VRNARVIALALALAGAVVSPSHSQSVFNEFLLTHELHVKPTYRTWSSDRGDRIYQSAIPLVYILPVTDALALDLSTAIGRSHLSNPSETIAAMADTRVRASFVTLDNMLLLSAGVILPTGHAELRPDERIVAASLASPVLDFPVSFYGQGPGVTAGAAYAIDLGGAVLGVGLGTFLRGSFKPSTESDATYHPGNELTGLVGLETSFRLGSVGWRILGDIDYTVYGTDTFGGTEVFRSGDRWMFNFQTEVRARSYQVLLFVQDRTKGKNERGLGTLLPEAVNTNGNQLDIWLDGTFPIGKNLRLRAYLESKLYANNDFGTNGATILGGGPGFEAEIARGLWAEAALKYFGGTLTFVNGETAVSGLHSDLAIRVAF